MGDQERFGVGTVIVKGEVGGRQRLRRHFAGAQHQGRVGIELAQAQLSGQLDHLLGGHGLHHLGVGGVDRLLGRLSNGHPTGIEEAVVVHLPVGAVDVGSGHHQPGRGVVGTVQAVALPDVLGQNDRLERRARLTPGSAAFGSQSQVHLAAVVVAAPHHHPHGPELVQGHHGAVRITRRVREAAIDGCIGLLLPLGVDRRVDANAPLVDQFLGLSVPTQELLRLIAGLHQDELVTRVLEVLWNAGEVARCVSVDVTGLSVGGHHQQLLFPFVVGLGQIPLLHHGREHRIAHLNRCLLMFGGFGPSRVSHQPHQKSRLRSCELGRRLVEVHPGRRFDARGRAPVEGLIQVVLKDLLLGHRALELDRQHRFLHLAHQRALVGQVGQLHVLLGNRGAALQAASALRVLVETAGDTEGIETLVLKELAVLRGHHRLLHHHGNVVVGQRTAFRAGEDLPGRIVDAAGAHRHRRVADQGGVRQRIGDLFGEIDLVEQAPHTAGTQYDDDHCCKPKTAAPPKQAAAGGGLGGHDASILAAAAG